MIVTIGKLTWYGRNVAAIWPCDEAMEGRSWTFDRAVRLQIRIDRL